MAQLQSIQEETIIPKSISNKKARMIAQIKKYWVMYLFLIPGIIFTLIFKYIPLAGNIIAFNDYDIFSPNGPLLGMFTSPWVGLKHFERLLADPTVWNVIKNTIVISFYKILFLQPIPIVLAILINEVRNNKFKKLTQTIYYLPHFLSWVIVSGLFLQVLGAYGPINTILQDMGIISEPIKFFANSDIFRPLLVVSGGWKEVGWNTIIYLAALTAVDTEMYEAAVTEGANKLQQILYITIPSISSTILMLFIIRLGHLFDAGFDQVFNMYSPIVYDVGDIIGTYVYRMGIGQMNYSFSAAVSVFEAVLAVTILFSANKLCRKLFDKGIW